MIEHPLDEFSFKSGTFDDFLHINSLFAQVAALLNEQSPTQPEPHAAQLVCR
jgi:hypothetical protein